MPDDYGAAEPIVSLGRRAYKALSRFGGDKKTSNPDDTHARMVREANESFRKPPARSKSRTKKRR